MSWHLSGASEMKALVKLVWRCWPYYRPQLKHLITFVALNLLIGFVIYGSLFLANDLIENKILLGERLQPLQAKLLLVGDDYVTTGAADEARLSDEQRQRVRLGVLIAGAAIWVVLTAYVAAVWYYMIWIYQRINQHLRVEMLARAEHLSLKYHSQSRTGDAIYRVYQDSATITHVLQYIILGPLRVVASVAFMLLLLLFFSPWLGLIIIAAAVPIVWLMRRQMPVVREQARLARERNSDLTARIQESLAAIRVIKASGAEQRLMAKFEADSQQALDAAFAMRKAMAVLMMAVLVIGLMAVLVAEYFMATWAITEQATYLGGTIALVGYAVWNLGAYKTAASQGEKSAILIWELAYLWSIVQDLTVGLKRAFYLLDLEPEVTDPEHPRRFPSALTSVSFREVVFAYGAEQPVLKGVNLNARPGSVTAIVGGTGAGKSTLMSLLLRLYDPDTGEVSINGIDLREFGVDEVRANVAIALQQNILFAQSIADNLRYGRDDIDDRAVVEAAKIACADEFINQMPEGYATELGERGGKLSTGQRQRLSIARAVLRDTPILILDEPTASLDAETEHRVLANLAAWGRDRVVFIITHRLSTIRNADQIALLEHGKLIELGTHEELLARQGAYHRFVQAEIGPTDEGAVDE